MIIEKELIAYLISANIEGIGGNVFAEVPLNKPKRYIIINRTTGDARDRVNRALVAIRSISANSMLEAIEMNAAVKEAMEAMPFNTGIYSARLNSDYNYTDTSTKEYRYQAVFEIYYP